MGCCVGNDVWLRYSDFESPTSLSSKFLKGRRFRLLWDKHIALEEGVQWLCKPLGGFDLLGGLEIGTDGVIVLQFY